MAALTLATLTRKVREVLQDLGTEGAEWSDAQITRALNWAQEQVARQTGVTYRDTTPANQNGATLSTPADAMVIERFFSSKVDGGPMTTLVKSSIQFEDRKDPDWRSKTGTPTRWVEQSGSVLRIIPNPPAQVNVTVGYLQRPTAMAASGDTPDARILEYYHEALKYAAAAYLINIAAVFQDMALSNEYMNKFNALIGGGRDAVAVDDVDR